MDTQLFYSQYLLLLKTIVASNSHDLVREDHIRLQGMANAACLLSAIDTAEHNRLNRLSRDLVFSKYKQLDGAI